MILKGRVSSMEPEGTRVTFPDRNDAVSAPLQKLDNVEVLETGDRVVVAFFSGSMKDGVIIGKY